MADRDQLPPESGQHQLPVSIVVYVFLALTSVLVPLRCYVRVHMMHKFGLDDWALLVAQALMIATGAVTLLGVQHQLGEYLTPESPYLSTDLLRLIWVNEIIYGLLILAIRLAIGLLLMRILACAGRPSTLVKIILLVSCCNAVQFLVGAIFQCHPIMFWTSLVSLKCHERAFTIISYVHSGLGIFTEWLLAIIPIVLAYNMTILKRRDRIAVAFALCFGICASVITCVRMVYLHKVISGHGDIRYYCGAVYMWACIENGLAISAVCLATFRPLLTPFLQTILGVPDELSGELMRKPSQTTFACPLEHGHSALTRTNTRTGEKMDFSDVLLAQIEANEFKGESKSPDIITPTCVTPTCELTEDGAMDFHMEIQVVDVQTDPEKRSP